MSDHREGAPASAADTAGPGSAELEPEGAPAPARPTRARRWLILAAKIVLTVGVTSLILRGAGFRLAEASEVVDWSMVRFGAPTIALSIALLLATFPIAAWLWSRVLVAFGEAPLPVARGAAILVVANLGRYVPGKVLQLAGVAVLARRAGVSVVHATGTAVVCQMLNLTGAVIVGGWVAYGTEAGGRWGVVAGVGTALAMSAFLYFGGAGALLGRVLRWFGRDGDVPSASGRRLLLWLPGYILNWLVFGAAFALLARGLGFDVPIRTATTAFAAAYFLGYVAIFSPAGLGVREGVLAALLTPLLGLDAGLALAALQRVWITAVEIAGAAAGAVFLRRPAV